jgi:hypothetical protein
MCKKYWKGSFVIWDFWSEPNVNLTSIWWIERNCVIWRVFQLYHIVRSVWKSTLYPLSSGSFQSARILYVIEEVCTMKVTFVRWLKKHFSMSSPFAFNSRNVRFVKYFTDSKEMTSNICKMRLFNCVNWDKNFKLTRDVSSEWTEGCWQINRVWRFATVESASNLENKSS